ncbi:MAG TPA: HAMP domain-containing sensor histidine kinase [Rhizobacter sp.]|nr:HAMP domain-containing sensor histidine kinase [Rhizobacter sp.]
MALPPDTPAIASSANAWLAATDPFQAFALVAGTVMLVIAVAQWLASYVTDRRALRLFSIRYALAAPGWYFAHPAALGTAQDVPFASALVAIGLLTLTIWALDEYIGQASRRRLLGLALAATGAALGIWLYLQRTPGSPMVVYVVMAAAMSWCAALAWQASRKEHNAGHLYIAIAFATYPLVLTASLLQPRDEPSLEYGYLAALPATVVGITILVVSLIRARRRTEDELVLRLRAEAALRELNINLEQRVQARTGELQTMLDGLEAFTRNVSHDLRGPLAGMAGVARMAEQALDEGDTQHAHAMLRAIASQADHLQTMVQDLLTLSRVNSAEFQRSPQALRELVDAAVQQLELTPEGADDLKKVQLQIDKLPNDMADPDLLRQVFVNLIGNAARFAASRPSGQGTVRVGAETADGHTAVYVADDGPGFEPSQADKLFKPFRRLHDSRLSRNGIGLSIVRRIVERHGGRVWAESQPGGGATFWFTLGR